MNVVTFDGNITMCFKFISTTGCSLIYPASTACAPSYIVICSLFGCAVFSTLFHTCHDFLKNLWNLKCALWFPFQLLSETYIILRRIQGVIIINDTCLHVKHPSFFSYCKETWIYATEFRKVVKYQISWKTVQWQPSCSMRTDRQMDGRIGMMKLNSCF
jgi:hypothetical protein